MKRVLVLLFAIASAIILSVAFTSSPANASTGHTAFFSASGKAAPAAAGDYFYINTTGAQTRFYPTGEHIYVCDTSADGHHAEGYWLQSNSSSEYHGYDYHGANTCVDYNRSIPESGWAAIQACRAEGSTLLNCSPYSPRLSANG